MIADIAALSTTAQASAAFQSRGGAVPLFAATDEALPAPSPLSAASPPHPASVSDAAPATSMIDLLIPTILSFTNDVSGTRRGGSPARPRPSRCHTHGGPPRGGRGPK